jgi:DNA (cytosine-5)-methyltransferase 1
MEGESVIHLDLFSGIGGFALAAKWAWGEEHHIHSFIEIDPFCQKVLAKNFPRVPIHGDIKTFTYTNRNRLQEPWAKQQTDRDRQFFKDDSVDLLTGGFPCQPFSHAGKRNGTEDNRYLWPEMFRVIRELHPRWIIAENVPGLISIENGMVFEQVCSDLESENYQVQAFKIPACGVNAPHRRDRVWIVANRDKFNGHNAGFGTGQISQFQEAEVSRCLTPDPNKPGPQEREMQSEDIRAEQPTIVGGPWRKNWLEIATRLCRVDDGLSGGLVRPKGWRVNALKAWGNSIVPQVAYQIMMAIKETDQC